MPGELCPALVTALQSELALDCAGVRKEPQRHNANGGPRVDRVRKEETRSNAENEISSRPTSLGTVEIAPGGRVLIMTGVKKPATNVSVQQWQNVAEIFELMDADRSGDIDRHELEAVVVQQGYSKDVAKLLMAELDTDGDGRISWDIFKTGLAQSSFMPARPPALYDWTGVAIALIYFPLGAIVYAVLEGWSPIDTIYFLVVTSTTVGYGDLSPSSPLGKLFTCVYALLGMTLVFSALAPVINALQEAIDRVEQAVTSFLELHSVIPPAVNTLDMSLSVSQINASISCMSHRRRSNAQALSSQARISTYAASAHLL